MFATDRRPKEEALLDELINKGEHRRLEMLLDLDTFQCLDRQADQSSLLEFALKQLARFSSDRPDFEPAMCQLLAKTALPFARNASLHVAQLALVNHYGQLFEGLFEHPSAPTKEVWLSARWVPAKRKDPDYLTWPAALAQDKTSSSLDLLAKLFRLGWASEDGLPFGQSWLAYADERHIFLAKDRGDQPTMADREHWRSRFLEGGLSQQAISAFGNAWGTFSVSAVTKVAYPSESLNQLILSGVSPSLPGQLTAINHQGTPWWLLSITDRGPTGKKTLWSPVGLIFLRQIKEKSPYQCSQVFSGFDLIRAFSPERQACPGLSEGALAVLLSATSYAHAKEMDQFKLAQTDQPSAQWYWEQVIQATEVLFNRGEMGQRIAPVLNAHADKRLRYAWQSLWSGDSHNLLNNIKERVSHHVRSEGVARLMDLGVGFPASVRSDEVEKFFYFIIELATKDIAVSCSLKLATMVLSRYPRMKPAPLKRFQHVVETALEAGAQIDTDHWSVRGIVQGETPLAAVFKSLCRQQALAQAKTGHTNHRRLRG